MSFADFLQIGAIQTLANIALQAQALSDSLKANQAHISCADCIDHSVNIEAGLFFMFHHTFACL